MTLAPLMTVHADLKSPADIGTGPYGTRMVFDVTGGHFEGERLRGTLFPSGGDWLLIDAEGVGHLDVRITLATDDGARIYVQYCGSGNTVALPRCRFRLLRCGPGGPSSRWMPDTVE